MICSECNYNDAVYHNEIDGVSQHLCAECYHKKMDKQLKNEYFYNPILSDHCCKTCGQTFEEFQKTGLVGCSDCYFYFKEELKPVILKMQGSLIHYGKEKSTEMTEEEKEYMELSKQLKQAVYNEDYELATHLQQRILSFRDIDGSK